MINSEQLIEIGYVTKLHGLKGELLATVTDTVFDDVKHCPYFVIEMDGIYVPFFISSYRFRSAETMLLQLDDIDSQVKAEGFCGKKLYFDRKCFSKKEAAEYERSVEEDQGYIGYQIIDTKLGPIGEIIDIDDQTANVLFLIKCKDQELMIPAADDLVVSIDDNKRTIIMDLPDGLIEL